MISKVKGDFRFPLDFRDSRLFETARFPCFTPEDERDCFFPLELLIESVCINE